jgi:nitrate/nitrite-specific signal transduction histidine kinase
LAIAFQQNQMREQLRRHAADLECRVEERTRELQESLGRVKQLQGLLPICAWCKKVRDGKDYWHQVEHYISAHTDAKFSHGICPACLTDVMEKYNQSGKLSES